MFSQAHLSLENYEARSELAGTVPSYNVLMEVAVGRHEWASLERRANWPTVSVRGISTDLTNLESYIILLILSLSANSQENAMFHGRLRLIV